LYARDLRAVNDKVRAATSTGTLVRACRGAKSGPQRSVRFRTGAARLYWFSDGVAATKWHHFAIEQKAFLFNRGAIPSK